MNPPRLLSTKAFVPSSSVPLIQTKLLNYKHGTVSSRHCPSTFVNSSIHFRQPRHLYHSSSKRSTSTTSHPKASMDTPTHVVTIIANEEQLLMSAIRTLKSEANLTGSSISSWCPLSDRAVQADFHYRDDSDMSTNQLSKQLRQFSEKGKLDIIVQPYSLLQTRKRLAVFDLDSTLIQQETIDELASQLNIQSEVSDITERAMTGQLDFKQALYERVELLKGLPVHELDAVKERIVLTDGARELIKVLGKLDITTCVISGGFEFLAFHIKDELKINHAFANDLDVVDNVLTGKTKGDIVDAEFKKAKLIELANDVVGVKNMAEVMAVGDGSNDLLMLKQAGLGIAFNAKPVVQQQIDIRINFPSLHNVLYLLGLSDDDIQLLLDN